MNTEGPPSGGPTVWRNHNFKCFLFEVLRTVPTIGLPLHLRRRVPHDAIERSQNGAGECQYRGDKDQAFVHVTTLITASASAQTLIHSASTAIVPKATSPMPVIASLIGSLTRSGLVHISLTREPAYCSHQSPLIPRRFSELSAKSFRGFWRQEFVCRLNVRHAANSAFKNIQVGQVVKSRRQSNEPHDLSAAWATRRP